MTWMLHFFGGGDAFFVGVALLLLAVMVAERGLPRIVGWANIAALAGLGLVILSSTPFPIWVHAGAALVTLIWLIAERVALGHSQVRVFRRIAAALWLILAGLELPYHWPPTIKVPGRPTLFIIGDSIAAGMGGERHTWPRLLVSTYQVPVADFSQMGATVASALQQAERLPTEGGLVLLEIGGNDLLGPTSATAFEMGLDQLLTAVCQPGRTVLMFELPLPPLHDAWGRAQRRLAAKHGVTLIPKRIFVGVLTAPNATLDTIHLSPTGHERMADAVWRVIGGMYGGNR